MKVLMTIKAPRGKCRIFPISDIMTWWLDRHRLDSARFTPFNKVEQESYARFYSSQLTKRGLRVKAFMRGVGRNNGCKPR